MTTSLKTGSWENSAVLIEHTHAPIGYTDICYHLPLPQETKYAEKGTSDPIMTTALATPLKYFSRPTDIREVARSLREREEAAYLEAQHTENGAYTGSGGAGGRISRRALRVRRLIAVALILGMITAALWFFFVSDIAAPIVAPAKPYIDEAATMINDPAGVDWAAKLSALAVLLMGHLGLLALFDERMR